MKKLAYMLIGAAFMLILSFSYAALAENASTAASTTTEGTLQELDRDEYKVRLAEQQEDFRVSKNVWVYRDNQSASLDDLERGDQVELIFNSKKQVAYLKAYSSASAKIEENKQEGPKQAQNSEATGKGSYSKEVNTEKAFVEGISNSEYSHEDKDQRGALLSVGVQTPVADLSIQHFSHEPAWDKLEFELKGHDFEIEIKQERKKKTNKSTVKIELDEQEKIELKGQAAERFIQQLLAAGPQQMNSKENLESLATHLLHQLNLDPQRVELKLEVKVDGAEYKWEHKLNR